VAIQNRSQLTSVLQLVNTLAGGQKIPVPSLPANRHLCHQEFCLTHCGRVLQFQFHAWMDLANRG
jgi:hypothetical protein